MFKLERVEISGFKSFYDRVDLSFPGDVTAVVGPNGCGKSNICDAVAWALGEQSAKTLRGERMDDVIFNGSARRRPLGMAEVILTLSRRGLAAGADSSEGGADGTAQVSPSAAGNGNGNGNGNGHAADEGDGSETLRIGRRVYREGQGEYFLNDRQVRLKDIQDRLLGTGLGVRAYSVIEQGRIDQVLSTKPQDRRRLIEEAAGITRYKLKKRLAEAKLEETRGNLLRISDIVSEIERNVASLKRQASRAARFKEKSEALRSRRAAIARARHDRLVAAASDCARVLAERRDAEAQAAAALARAEADLAAARLSAAEAAGERDRLRDAVAALEAAIQRDDTLLEGNRRALADLLERRGALERDGRDASDEQARVARELAELSDRLARAVEDARARSEAREQADRRAAEAAAALAELERELDRTRAEVLSAAGDRVASRNARHEVDLEASRAAASIARLAADRGRLIEELAERIAEMERAAGEHAGLEQAAEAARSEVARREREVSALAARIAEAEAARETAREALGSAEHRAGALKDLLASREGTAHRFRESLSGSGVAHGGLLSDRLRPARGWEAAVDLLLGDELEAVLDVADPERALASARRLPSASLVRASWRPVSPPPSGAYPGWEAALENFGELSPAEKAALPAAAFVQTFEQALELAPNHPTVTFVTRGRELVRGSFVRSANHPPEASGVFAARRELADLESRTAEGRASVATLEGSLEDLRRDRTHRESELPLWRERERESGGLLSGALARLEERRAGRERCERELSAVASEMEALQLTAASLQERRASLEEDERRHAAREAELREKSDGLAARLPEGRALAMAAAEELSHRRTEAEVAAERRRSAEAAKQRLVETGAALDRRLHDASEESLRLASRAAELAAEEKGARERQAANLAARQTTSGELASAAQVAAEASTRVERAEESTRTERTALDAAREARFEGEVAHTRAGSDLEHLVEQARAEFGVAPDELPAPQDDSPEALEALEREAVELAEAIERMGPVNVLAWEEYQQETERLTFLSTQRDDLLKSIAELQESIRRINSTSSERFRQAFEAINENFKAMFARLFQGGTAEMRLLDENDLLESGVEIVAQPPGKRNQSILLLSGGEKALTAVALLMAIFRYKPSPFCILDEVDAPLDEVNIDRFTRLLRDMTEDTQFIAITHNKRTMETADVMYGVTMEEPGCSKIVSVRFD
jgi:chromosome segregation protein